MPKISVIVPVYKVEKYLDRCVKSIIGQTYPDFELILVDDGSPDKCPQMCDEWAKKDKRIRVLHKENGGLSSARNAGLRVARGEYVHFIDSDDWIELDLYENILNLFKIYTSAQIVQFGSIEVHKQVKIRQPEERIELYDKNRMFDYFFRVNGEKSNTSVWNKIIKSSVLDGFEFVITLNEDVEGSYELFTRTNVLVNTNKIYYHYYVNKMGITRSKFSLKDMDYLNVWNRVVERTKNEHPAYYNYAKFGRKRANFTLLSKMFIYGYDRNNHELLQIHSDLKHEVRQDFYTLLKSNIPLSRKILLCLIVL